MLKFALVSVAAALTLTQDLKQGTGAGVRISPPGEAWTNWTAVIPEPAVPQISAGQSYTSMGNTVWRITDRNTSRSLGAESDCNKWQHYYGDRSPLNADSTYIVMQDCGAGTAMQKINPETGAPVGRPFAPNSDRAGGSIGVEGHWDPSNSDRYYTIIDGKVLKSYSVKSNSWKTVKDFAPALKAAPAGRCKIMFLSADGDRMVVDYESVGKHNEAIIFFRVSTKEANVFIGTRMTGWHPAPNKTFIVNGTNSPLPKSGNWYMTQASGGAINGSSPKPIERQNAATYRVSWGSNPLAEGDSLAGDFNINHGTSLTNHHVRVAGTEEGWYNGLTNGNPDWLLLLRKMDMNGKPNPANANRIEPYTDLFMIPSSFGMSGIHISNIGSKGAIGDNWIVASLYQERGSRKVGPLANEIVAIDTRQSAAYDEAKHTIKQQGRIRRLGHHFSYPEVPANHSYWAAPRAAMSLDQKFVVFTSSFGNTGSNSVFVMKLPPLN
jgi:hypothetical protein